MSCFIDKFFYAIASVLQKYKPKIQRYAMFAFSGDLKHRHRIGMLHDSCVCPPTCLNHRKAIATRLEAIDTRLLVGWRLFVLLVSSSTQAPTHPCSPCRGIWLVTCLEASLATCLETFRATSATSPWIVLWTFLETLPSLFQPEDKRLFGWRPSLVGWRLSLVRRLGTSLLCWRPSLLGWRPSLLGWRPSLLGTKR